jgi:hypothetical protein
MSGPWRFHIAEIMMLVVGDLWNKVRWHLPPGKNEMVPVIVNVREDGIRTDGTIVIDSLQTEGATNV